MLTGNNCVSYEYYERVEYGDFNIQAIGIRNSPAFLKELPMAPCTDPRKIPRFRGTFKYLELFWAVLTNVVRSSVSSKLVPEAQILTLKDTQRLLQITFDKALQGSRYWNHYKSLEEVSWALYIKIFRKLGVSSILSSTAIRLNKKCYDRTRFTRHGMWLLRYLLILCYSVYKSFQFSTVLEWLYSQPRNYFLCRPSVVFHHVQAYNYSIFVINKQSYCRATR